MCRGLACLWLLLWCCCLLKPTVSLRLPSEVPNRCSMDECLDRSFCGDGYSLYLDEQVTTYFRDKIDAQQLQRYDWYQPDRMKACLLVYSALPYSSNDKSQRKVPPFHEVCPTWYRLRNTSKVADALTGGYNHVLLEAKNNRPTWPHGRMKSAGKAIFARTPSAVPWFRPGFDVVIPLRAWPYPKRVKSFKTDQWTPPAVMVPGSPRCALSLHGSTFCTQPRQLFFYVFFSTPADHRSWSCLQALPCYFPRDLLSSTYPWLVS